MLPMGLLPASSVLPVCAGMGLRASHYREVLDTSPNLAWVEVHSENFFDGGLPLHTLLRVRARCPVSLHGVGMGLGSPDPLDLEHLHALKRLVDCVEPAAVSEHLCWNQNRGEVFNDLLPFPLSRVSMERLCDKIDRVQNHLGRQLWIENLSYYLAFPRENWGEGEFLNELCRRTGCGLLLDVNNLYVNHLNFGIDVEAILQAVHPDHVHEYHLAGFTRQGAGWVDTHSVPVAEEVWQWFARTLTLVGGRPTLIEWDNDIPSLTRLLEEVERAQGILEQTAAFLRHPSQNLQGISGEFSEKNQIEQLARSAFPVTTLLAWPGGGEAQETDNMIFDWFSQQLNRVDRDGSDLVPEGQETQCWGVGIYRNNVRENLIAALQGAYPVLHQLVGEPCFRQLAERYRCAHPSRNGNLHAYGAQFSEFLGREAIVIDWPWFPAVACLEWACHTAYFAPDSVPIDMTRLALVHPRDYANLRFVAHPAIRLVELDHAILSIWQAHQPQMPDWCDLEYRTEREWVLVTRQYGQVIPVRLESGVARWWHYFLSGHSLGEMMKYMAHDAPDRPVEALWVDALHRGWLVDFMLN